MLQKDILSLLRFKILRRRLMNIFRENSTTAITSTFKLEKGTLKIAGQSCKIQDILITIITPYYRGYEGQRDITIDFGLEKDILAILPLTNFDCEIISDGLGTIFLEKCLITIFYHGYLYSVKAMGIKLDIKLSKALTISDLKVGQKIKNKDGIGFIIRDTFLDRGYVYLFKQDDCAIWSMNTSELVNGTWTYEK